jgi:hypothetical protein
MGLRSGLCAGQSSSSTPILTNHSFMDLALCRGELSCWNWKRPSRNCCLKFGSTESSRMLLYAVVLRLPFPWLKLRGHALTIKISHRSFFLLHQTLQLALCIGEVAFSWHPPNPDSTVGLPDGEVWFSTPESAFPLLQSPMAVSSECWNWGNTFLHASALRGPVL